MRCFCSVAPRGASGRGEGEVCRQDFEHYNQECKNSESHPVKFKTTANVPRGIVHRFHQEKQWFKYLVANFPHI
jgi:hypothetical protein